MLFGNAMKKFVCVAALGMGLMGGMAASASACDVYYKQVWVTRYETQEVAYQVRVVSYDCYGYPVVSYRTVYKTVEVPVQKLITVAYNG